MAITETTQVLALQTASRQHQDQVDSEVVLVRLEAYLLSLDSGPAGVPQAFVVSWDKGECSPVMYS